LSTIIVVFVLTTQSRTALDTLYYIKISHAQLPVLAIFVAKFVFCRT